MATLELRPLQSAAIAAVSEAFKAGYKNVMVQAPCGFGKTELATAMLLAADENMKRAAFICDRLSLIHQTEERFDKYGLKFGVSQANHWRAQPWQRIQLCSVQTLNKRRWPEASLYMIDEAHVLHGSVKKQLEKRECYSVGLSGTPTTRGLGKYFDVVVNAATTNQLIADGLLSPYRIFAASEPMMDGVKIIKGEYEEHETEKRVLPIVGDVVTEYLKHGNDQKFICFAVNVAHAEEIQKQFLAAGIIVELYTYLQKDAERQISVTEFRKPDSYIRGMISIEALTRGFDIADIGVLILARPLRSSLAVHLQMFGRVLRTAEGKTQATVLCHSGNCIRFWHDQNDFFENGISKLDDGKRKEKKKPEKKEKKPIKCPKCFAVHPPAPSCPQCGFIYPKYSNVEHQAGELKELAGGPAATREDKQEVYSMLLHVVRERGYNPGWVNHKFRTRFGVWPKGLDEVPKPPSPKLMTWLRHEQIKWVKSKRFKEAPDASVR
jgi:superfamily II DNA or RNA helicase